MLLTDYISKQRAALPRELADRLISETSIWTNDACYGYVIQAMEERGYSEEKIREIISSLHGLFDELSPENAEKYWQNW